MDYGSARAVYPGGAPDLHALSRARRHQAPYQSRCGPCRDLDSGLLDAVFDVLEAEFSCLLTGHSVPLAVSATLCAARLEVRG